MHYQEMKAAWAELTAPGAPFEIEELTVRGYPLRSYRNVPPNVRAIWLSTTAFAERDYLVYQDERMTYGEAHRQVGAIAAWLFAQGVTPGERVAIAMRNYPDWILAYWACVSVGVAVVGMNAWWTPSEMAYALKDSQPRVIFADRERLERLAEVPDRDPALRVVAVRTPPPAGATAWREVVESGGALPEVEIDPDADACIFYTSGTTGFPKGAQLTHRGCATNLMNMMFSAQVQGLATLRGTGAAPPDPEAPIPPPVGLLVTPLFHVTANNCSTYVVTAAGGTLVLMYRWDPGEALRLIASERVTAMSGVPVMSRELIAHPDFTATDTSSLLSLGGGGAQLQPDLVARIDAHVATARPQTGYGMTETCGIITAVAGDFFIDRPASAGPAMPAYETRIVDDEGRDQPAGGVGELWVRGAAVVKGYLNRPEATAEAITEGWMHTGDLARIDADGFIYLVDRKKDMVLRGGENVYCVEVEASVYRHPAVAECCVFGVEDERLGEEVAAAIVLHPGQRLDAAALRTHCATHLSRHKIPRYIWMLDQPIPRNASGKFLKRELRDTLRLDLAS